MPKLAWEHYPKEKQSNYRKGTAHECCEVCRYYKDKKCSAFDDRVVGKTRICDDFDIYIG